MRRDRITLATLPKALARLAGALIEWKNGERGTQVRDCLKAQPSGPICLVTADQSAGPGRDAGHLKNKDVDQCRFRFRPM